MPLNITPQDLALPKLELKPSDYIWTKELQQVVRVAIMLKKPLLLTGEPGTGKTELAKALANYLSEQDENFLKKPIMFNTKTTSIASDLFYIYDALGHFQSKNEDVEKFIRLEGLGKAIAFTNSEVLASNLYRIKSGILTDEDNQPKSSVVLIDEIDKAPRDFPNDILHEIDKNEFWVRENQNHGIKKTEQGNIFVIMTSNSEKNLPDAFLRRCIYFNIMLPDASTLLQIIKNNIPAIEGIDDTFSHKLIALRDQDWNKKPSTAEFVLWLNFLKVNDLLETKSSDWTEEQKSAFEMSISILFKTKADLEKAISKINDLKPN